MKSVQTILFTFLLVNVTGFLSLLTDKQITEGHIWYEILTYDC